MKPDSSRATSPDSLFVAYTNATLKLIDANYRLTIVANSAILGAAALGWLSPVLASLLHNGTTIGILLNALRGGRGFTPARALVEYAPGRR